MNEQSLVLSINNVGFKKNNACLIDDISFDLTKGEILALVGPNGAGKTTLLNTLTHELEPTTGTIQIAGQAIEQLSLQERAKRIAVLPQLSLLNFPYSVEQVVSLSRIPHTTGVQIDNDIVTQAMQELDIAYLKGRIYTALSGGEKQRVQIARVLAQIWREEDAGSRILLLDEPTSALDLGHQQMLMKSVRKMADDGVAVVMIVHDINIALAHAHSIVALSCGKVLAQGKVKEVVNEALLTTLFQADVRLFAHPENPERLIVA